MAIITCPFCNSEISDCEKTCTRCGKKMRAVKSAIIVEREKMARNAEDNAMQELRRIREQTPIAEQERNRASIVAQSKTLPVNNVPRCPYCGCTQIQAVTKGFSVGKAAVGGLLLGPVGLLGGALGANKVKRVCLACGKTF